MGTFIVLVILILIVSAIIKSMIKKKKSGKSIMCDGTCSGCSGCSMGCQPPEKTSETKR